MGETDKNRWTIRQTQTQKWRQSNGETLKLESRRYTHLWKTGETTIHQLMEDKRNRDTVYRLMEEGQQYTDL